MRTDQPVAQVLQGGTVRVVVGGQFLRRDSGWGLEPRRCELQSSEPRSCSARMCVQRGRCTRCFRPMLSDIDLKANQPIRHVPRSSEPAEARAWRIRALPYVASMTERSLRKACTSLQERRPVPLRATSAS